MPTVLLEEFMNSLDFDQQTILEKSKLTQLLDYVAYQESGSNKTPYQIPLNSYLTHKFQDLRGLSVSSNKADWFSIKRLEVPDEEPELPEYLRYYLTKNNDDQYEYIAAGLKKLISFKKSNLPQLTYISDIRPIKKAFEVLKYCSEFLALWAKWANANEGIHKSVKFYDQLFYWHNTINVGVSVENTEIVAGFGLIQCRLPSGQLYRYPLITIPLEIDVQANGVITVGPKDTNPRIEFDAFLQETKLTSTGVIKDTLKNIINDGRFLDIFDNESYEDVTTHFAATIDSRAAIVPDLDSLKTTDQIVVSNASLIFARPHISSVIKDDVEALKAHLNLPDTEVPEQPRSLITPLSDSRKKIANIAFRGRSGVEGKGDEVRELYFPLPYNKEQVMIVRNNEQFPGVVVQGPPGTGKTHTIVNIISHYLACGKKVLVTAQQPHVLNTIHEKLPEKIKSLVISRVGNSQQSKRQLEASVDNILQTLTQINEGDLQKEVEDILLLIEEKHQIMSKLDTTMSSLAKKHLEVLHLNGRDFTVPELTKFIQLKDGVYNWFDVEKNRMDSEFNIQIPTQEEYEAVKRSRSNIKSLLKDYDEYIKLDVSNLPNSEQIETFAQLIISQKTWGFKFNWTNVQESGHDRHDLGEAKQRLDTHKEHLESVINRYKWANAFYRILMNSKVEFQFLNELMKNEISELIEARKFLLRNPVNVPFDVETGSKEWDAINRVIETGVLVPWYHFDGKLKEKLQSITVSGNPPASQDDWGVVLKYLSLKSKYDSVALKWNAAIDNLGLFALDSSGSSNLMKVLSSLESYKQGFDELTDFYNQTVKLIREDFSKLDEKNKKIDQWLSLDKFNLIYEYFLKMEQCFSVAEMRISILSCLDAKIESQAANDKPFYKLEEVATSLRNICDGDQVERYKLQYLTLLKDISNFDSSYKDYTLICNFSEKVDALGATKVAEDIRTIPCVDMLEDPIVPDDLLGALDWARVYNFLAEINDYKEIEENYSKRKQIESELAFLYEDLSTKKTWLSLKLNASDKTLVCLNRFKISVQKIGKGTGKNAPRYRKDAQEALLEASKAIPCWIMSHYQVSETMPAEIGMFDLVIVDEASQSTIEALPVLMRAKKILVVGDNKQVSPSVTGFSAEDIQNLRDKHLYGQPHRDFLTPDQSLYDMASSIYDSSVMLLEHFRCHPSIIAYSNATYYDNKIKPMRVSRNSERLNPTLEPIFVSDGVRETRSNKHVNKEEAKAIVAEIDKIIRDVRADPNSKYKGKTIGAISLLGSAQAEYIQTQVFDAFGAEILSLMKFACGEASSFQGAERDIIFLSMVADPNNCYPLSGVAYEQRLNVAASRAREKMYLVHSVKTSDLSPKDLRLPLLSYFYTLQEEDPVERYEESFCKTEFELDVFRTLTDLGYRVKAKQDVGSYTIDLVVESQADNRLAIECDGDSVFGNWDDDVTKQRDLERSGWVFWRCFWSTWLMDKEGMLKALVNKLDSLNIDPISK